MLVVSDTSPLNYLILVDAVEVLPHLYGQIVVPPQVLQELKHPTTPSVVKAWVDASPPWLRIVPPLNQPPELGLGQGETYAIALAEELKADRLLIDERLGRRIASGRGLKVVGLLGVLDQADKQRLIDLQRTIDLLANTSFRADSSLIAEILRRSAARNA